VGWVDDAETEAVLAPAPAGGEEHLKAEGAHANHGGTVQFQVTPTQCEEALPERACGSDVQMRGKPDAG